MQQGIIPYYPNPIFYGIGYNFGCLVFSDQRIVGFMNCWLESAPIPTRMMTMAATAMIMAVMMAVTMG
jgi:hypothetical protein